MKKIYFVFILSVMVFTGIQQVWAVGKKPPAQGGNQNAAPNNPPNSNTTSGGTKPGDSWTPDNLKGTIWDEVPKDGYLRPEADGSYSILDKDFKVIKVVPPPGTTNAMPGGNTEPPPPPVQPPVPPTQQPLPPIVTPTQGGGTITSTQNPDGSWSHHYHRDHPDGSVDTDLKPGDDLYPHDDPRFWAPGQSSSGRVVTKTPGGGTITSTRNPDGTWSHRYHRETENGVVDYPLRPGDDMYPGNDPRFQNPNAPPKSPEVPQQPRDGQTGMNFPDSPGFGREIGAGLAERPHEEQHHDSERY